MTAAAARNGSAVEGNALDLSQVSGMILAQRQEAKRSAEEAIESAVLEVRRLRLAGMINRSGADEIQHRLCHALAFIEQL